MTKYENDQFKPTVDIIKRHYNGRKIIVFGKSEIFEELLFEELGIKPYKYMTAFKNKVDINHVFIDDFKNKNSQYYIVAPNVPYKSNNRQKIKAMGFKEFDDFVFSVHAETEVLSGLLDYSDEYGNKVHCNRRCKITIGERVGNTEIYVDDTCYFGDDCQIYIGHAGAAKLYIGKNCVFQGGNKIRLMADSELIIGEKTTMNVDTRITLCSGQKVTIGKDCMFSYQTDIYAGNGIAMYDINSRERINPISFNSPENGITIGDHVYIGMKAHILNPAVIGNSCVIEAGSLVRGTFSNNCIISGSPAKTISENTSWSRTVMSESIDDCGEENINFTEG